MKARASASKPSRFNWPLLVSSSSSSRPPSELNPRTEGGSLSCTTAPRTLRAGVGGDSAGANLATVVAHTLRGKVGLSLACQLLIYPATDMHFNTESIYRYATGYSLTASAMRYFREQY
eukprot:gene38565-50648_t